MPAAKTQRVTFNEITEGAIRDAFANPREHRHQPRRRPADAPDRRPPRRLHAEPAALAQGPLGPVGGARPVRGRPARRRAGARDRGVHRARVLDARGAARDRRRRGGSRPRSSGSTAQPIDVGDGETAERHAAALRTLKPVVTKVATRKQTRSPAPPFTTSTLQQEASRKLGFSPKRTMSIAQRLYEGADTPDGHVGLITYMRTDSTAIAGVAMGEARDVIGGAVRRAVHDAEGPGLQDEGEGRPGGPRVDPSDELPARSGLARGHAQARGAPPVPPDLAAGDRVADGGQGAGDDDGRARRRARTSCAPARRGRCSTASRGSTRRAATTAPRTTRTERLPALAEGDATTVEDVTPTQHFTEPPPRFTEATLIKALEEHGIGRPSTYAATISTIVDRGYVRIEERRLRPEIVGEHRHGPARRALRRLRRPRVHRPDGGGARRDRPRRARRGCRCSRRSTPPLRDRVDEVRKNTKRRDFTTEATDEVCSEGHPMVIRLGRNGRFLACSLYPGAQGVAAAPGRRGRAAGRRGRGLPAVRRGDARRQDAAGSGRSSAAPATRTATTSRRRARRPPTRCRSRSSARRTATATSSRVARGAPATSSGDAPPTRSATTRRTSSRSAPCTTQTTAQWPERASPAICLKCGADVPLPEGSDLVGERLAGGPPNPEALARPARGARRRGGRRWRVAAAAGRVAATARNSATDATDRERAGRVSGAAASHPALARFLRGLAARDASPNTRRVVRRRRSARTSTGSTNAASTGARRRRADLRAYLAHLGSRGARELDGPAAGRDPLVPPARRPRRAGGRRSRGAPSPRRACRDGCRGSSRSTRSSSCSPSSTRSSRRALG